MSLLKRLTMSAALIAAAAVVTNAVAPHPAVDQAKRDAIRQGLAAVRHTTPDWVVLQAGARAAALTSATVQTTTQQTVLSLGLDRPVLAMLEESGTNQLVLDVYHAVPVLQGDSTIPRDALVRAIDAELRVLEPQFVTRLSVKLSAPASVAFNRTATGLDVILTPMAKTSGDEALAQEIDRLLAKEQAQLAVRQSVQEEMSQRLDAMHHEHARFLGQALQDLQSVLHQCKIEQVKHQLDNLTPASAQVPKTSWPAQVAQLEEFLRDAQTQQTALAAGLRDHHASLAASIQELAHATETACEQHSAASVASAARGGLRGLTDAIVSALGAHDAAFNEIVIKHIAYVQTLDSAMASLRDHALAYQQEGRTLLAQTEKAPTATTTAAPVRPTSTKEALQAIMDLNKEIQAVADTRPDLAHVPATVAALDETVDAANEPTPPGKRDTVVVTTEPAQPVAEADTKINSRMQTIFPEIAGTEAALAEESVAAADAVAESPAEPAPTFSGDPLDQLVNIDFREMELSHVVSILAKKAQINVIAGTEVTGTVTANLRNVPLRQAMETSLRMNGLGMIEEDGIFRIVPYEEAVASRRATRMLYLNNAQSDEVKKTLDEVLAGSPDAALMSISANPSTNVIILSGPSATVDEFEQMIRNLDIAEPTLPTATRAFRLNYAEPTDIAKIVQSVLTAEIGQVATDDRSRQIIVTDIPIVIEQVAQLITDVDLPVKQVAIEAMVVDAVLADSAQTGTEWIAQAIRRESRRGEVVGNLSELALDTELGIGDDAVGTLTFGIISSELNVQATISAEVSSGNAKLLTNPQVVTIENQLAKISIAQEIPYREIRQSEAGGTQTTTSFKEVGTVLEVTPRVTHEDDVIVKIEVKQSDTKGEFEGIPIEDKREAGTTLRARDGQTIFIGGLRKFDDTRDVRKVPFLGDIPVANFLFRSNVNRTEINELMIFLTCHVLQEHVPDLTPYQQMKYDELGGTPLVPTTERDVMGNIVHPGRVREPFWKWRRNK